MRPVMPQKSWGSEWCLALLWGVVGAGGGGDVVMSDGNRPIFESGAW